MKKLNPTWVEAVLKLANQSPYFQLQTMEIMELETGRARIEIPVRNKHLQPFGMVHGGVYSTLIDAAGFWAAFTELEAGLGMTTVELKLNYLAPANSGRLVGIGTRIKTGRTLSLAEARVENETGRMLAHGTVTLMTVDNLPLLGEQDVPPKFLSEDN